MTPHAEYILRTPKEVQQLLAERFRSARLAIGYKQSSLAARAGVTLSTLRRFEQTGEISLRYLLRLSHVLSRLGEFEQLFEPPPAASIRELEAPQSQTKRSRGSL